MPIRAHARPAPSSRWSTAIITTASTAGMAAFLYPFIVPAVAETASGASPRSAEAPIVFGLLAGACLVALLAEVSTVGSDGRAPSARLVAVLAAMVCIDALLRLVPSVGGASPVFGLILLVGAAFGPGSGFLMGALTLLVSAMITGGLGPWLPYQMLAAGWVGLAAGWLPRTPGRPPHRAQLVLLAAVAGLAYGALMNLYSWPFLAPGTDAAGGLYWQPGLGLAETLERYRAYYLTTSLVHDLLRSAANVAFVLLFGSPVLRLLARFSLRNVWEPWDPPAQQ